jgi:hypothetical protein
MIRNKLEVLQWRVVSPPTNPKREILNNILTEFGIPRKLAGLIKMCLNDTYSTVCISKNLSEKFPIQNGLKQGDAL